MIITKTPLRISLVGGGTDMPQFYKHHVGGVVSFTINKYVYISVNPKFDDGIRVSYSQTENVSSLDDLKHDLARETLREWRITHGIEVVSVADIPGNGSGLGSSSAYVVGLVNALGSGAHPGTLAERAYIIESERCGHPVGKQDQYASAYGGMNYMTFRPNRVEIETLYPKRNALDSLLLLYTGLSRSANDILKEQGKRFNQNETLQVGKDLAGLAYAFRNEWLEGRVTPESVGKYLNSGWEFKKLLATVTNPEIDGLHETALRNGAYGGKLLGAGGGGFLLFSAPIETHARIAEATGMRRVDFEVSNFGSEIIYDTFHK